MSKLAREIRIIQREKHMKPIDVANEIIDEICRFIYDETETTYVIGDEYDSEVYDLLREAGFTIKKSGGAFIVSWKDASEQKDNEYKTRTNAYNILTAQNSSHDTYLDRAISICNLIKDKIRVSKDRSVTVGVIENGAKKILSDLGYGLEDIEEEYETFSGTEYDYYTKVSW